MDSDACKIKVVVDTDVGSDIDDALALTYLASHVQCDLVGITTVTGEPVARARLASAVMRHAGKPSVPIFPGAAHPLAIPQRQVDVPQARVLPKWSHQEDFPENQAVEFLRDTIRTHPCQVVLLAIGPLTNIAQLFWQNPDVPGLLKGFVMMGGLFEPCWHLTKEWNVKLDPHAAEIVFGSSIPAFRMIPFDVTKLVSLGQRRFMRELERRPPLSLTAQLAEIWFQKRKTVTFHDPLAAATIFDYSLCGYECGRLAVELPSCRKTGGRTTFQQDGSGRHHRAVSIDKKRFLEHFWSLLPATA